MTANWCARFIEKTRSPNSPQATMRWKQSGMEHDDEGNPLPNGKYSGRGYVVGDLKVEGVDYFLQRLGDR